MFSHVTLKRMQTLLRAVVTTAQHRIPNLSQGPEQGLITTNLANDTYNSFHTPFADAALSLSAHWERGGAVVMFCPEFVR